MKQTVLKTMNVKRQNYTKCRKKAKVRLFQAKCKKERYVIGHLQSVIRLQSGRKPDCHFLVVVEGNQNVLSHFITFFTI